MSLKASPTLGGISEPVTADHPARALDTVWLRRLVVPGLIVIGLALRLAYYIVDPSISTDEADLALNLMHRSYAGLFHRLDFNQAAPPGFLLLQKTAVEAFGTSTYALRLLPLLVGSVGFLLVYPVTARIAGRQAAVIALALFAVSDPLVSYAVTNKQYSFDVGVTVALFAVMLEVRRRTHSTWPVLLAGAGGLAVLLSNPAAFVLSAIWIVLVGETLAARKWRDAGKLVGVAVVWLAALGAAFLLVRASIDQIKRTAGLGWSFPGHPPFRMIGGIARYLLGVPGLVPEVRAVVTGMALVLCAVGVGSLYRKSRGLAIVLVAPAILAFAAVAIGEYPNFGRTFLFLEAPLMVLIGCGTAFLVSRARWETRAAASLAIGILIGLATFQTLRHVHASAATEPTRALAYLAEHSRGGDSLYVPRSSQYAFRYYLECGCFGSAQTVAKARMHWPIRPTEGYGQFDAAIDSAPPSLVAGASTGSSASDYRKDLAPLLGRKRVWVFLFDLSPQAKQAVGEFLRSHGRVLDAFPNDEGAPASVVLYRLDHRA
jgi:Dolichyl-phosphate-mannose-protein mannosyltransferase